ncbi:hypothetical protein KTN05_05985 [Paracoccus sp. Z118]|uniref:hypothetical protein n=1 Tax=Paracoccus sp. Z118 TaxID=2851017 RepID=UPI001C2B8D2B|nr:hypothetical protein [Paracoccus sp. Z118]MBV0891403.1 hypothetical protein [Paracoccus sp. Z118]
MHSPLGFIVLLSWPLVAAVLFSRLDRVRAVIWTILGGYLALPPVVAIDLPMIPAMDKNSVASVAALAGVLILGTGSAGAAPRMPGWIKAMLALGIASPALTALTNPEPLIEGVSYRPGMTPYDGFSGAIMASFQIIPFLLGYLVLSSPQALRAWLKALVIGALAYAPLMLVEIRLSPQINVWVYGFFAHDFGQMMRYGGFRPMVFLSHGLWVAIYTSAAVLAAAARVRDRAVEGAPKGKRLAMVAGLLLLLVLCKSAAAILYAVLLVPVILLTSPRMQFRVATVLALLVLLYPLARWVEAVPVREISDFVIGLDPERGQSLEFRLLNEDVLLSRAAEKPLTGWGGWNRNHEVNPDNGRVMTVTDGHWIVLMSAGGLISFVCTFGPLTWAVLRAARAVRRVASSSDLPAAGLALILATNMVDLIPNATLTSLTWVSAGVLAGWAVRRETEGAGAGAAIPQRAGSAPMRVILS